MSDYDVLDRIRALLTPSTTRDPPRRPEGVEEGLGGRAGRLVDVEALNRENRVLKADLERVKGELAQAKIRLSTDTSEVSHQRDVLIQADEAIVQLKSEIENLKREIQNQANVIRIEKANRQQAENNAQSSKIQQSTLAKERNQFESQVKVLKVALEKAEGKVRDLDGMNMRLSGEVRALQQRQSTGPIHNLRVMQEKAKANELRCKAAEDQLRQVRLQNDALRLQVESHNRKESLSPSHLPPSSFLDESPRHPSTMDLLRAHDLVKRPYELILRYIADNLPAILDFLPDLVKAIRLIVDAAAARLTRDRTGTRRSLGSVRREKGADGKQATEEHKLMADKANLKSVIREREKEITKLQDKNESLKRQNRMYIEGFKEQERASLQHSRRKKERAALAAHQPVLVPDPPEKLEKPDFVIRDEVKRPIEARAGPSMDQITRELARSTVKHDPFANLDEAFGRATAPFLDEEPRGARSSPDETAHDFMYGGAKI